jgi:hypothetical protein
LVVTRAALQDVRTSVSFQPVLPYPSPESIWLVATIETIVPGLAIEGVTTVLTLEG